MLFSELSSRRDGVVVPFPKDPEAFGLADNELTQFSAHIWVSVSALHLKLPVFFQMDEIFLFLKHGTLLSSYLCQKEDEVLSSI